MKPFKIGEKVEVLWSGNDNPAQWIPGEVFNVVKPMQGFEAHGQFTGNIVRINKGKFVEVTEPGMIRAAQ